MTTSNDFVRALRAAGADNLADYLCLFPDPEGFAETLMNIYQEKPATTAYEFHVHDSDFCFHIATMSALFEIVAPDRWNFFEKATVRDDLVFCLSKHDLFSRKWEELDAAGLQTILICNSRISKV